MATLTATETSTKTAPVVISQPASSKIIWTNVISGVVAIAAGFGFIIPEAWQTLALQILGVLTPIITIILRTWFTASKPPLG